MIPLLADQDVRFNPCLTSQATIATSKALTAYHCLQVKPMKSPYVSDAQEKAAPRPFRSALTLCASLLLAGAHLAGCAEEDDPYDDTGNPAVNGSNGIQDGSGAGGTTGSTADSTASTTGEGGGVSPGSNNGNTTGIGANGTTTNGGANGEVTGGASGQVNGSASGDLNGDVSGDASGSASGDTTGVAPREDLGEGDGSDVVMIGDSWMSLGGAATAIQGGVLKASGQPYRPHAFGGTTLLGGGIIDLLAEPIPQQYATAVAQNPNIQTVIMTGGGNDFLQTGLEDCGQREDDVACAEQATKVLDALTALWSEMAEDGVQDVIYILYSRPDNIDFALPDGESAITRCAAVPAPLRCHILPTADIVMGELRDDTIHPTQAASDRIGAAVYQLMIERGIRR